MTKHHILPKTFNGKVFMGNNNMEFPYMNIFEVYSHPILLSFLKNQNQSL